MARRGVFTIAALAGLAILMFVAGTYAFLRSRGPHYLGGPVAIVAGDPPKHGFLGVDFAGAVSAPLIIQNVTEGSGAADVGLQKGDVIDYAGQAKDPDFAALQHVLQASAPGDELSVRITRGRATMDLSVKLISFEELIVLRDRQESRKDGR
jgi:S1-C subfamily serine protease